MIFAIIMIDKKRLSNFWQKALNKYRFVIMTDDSFEERFSLKLSKLTILGFLIVIFIFCFFSSLLLITKTSLNEYVPGKEKSEVQKELVFLTMRADSLLAVLNNQKIYLNNIANIISGRELLGPKDDQFFDTLNNDISFERSIDDSLLRVYVESEERGALYIEKKKAEEIMLFFPPLNGFITDKFNPQKKHFGIDLVAKEKTRIASVLEGNVVFSNWTAETGYVIGIQHNDGYFSLYKHNSSLLKSVGDFVSAGDYVAIIGNSGEFSSGPHLHFELWHEGTPVDPENFISF